MNPLIFETKFFTLYSLWLFFGIALVIGTYLLVRLTIKEGLKVQFLSENAFGLFVSTLVAARIFHIASEYASYFYELSLSSLLRMLNIGDQGLSFWGAAIGFTVYLYHICKKNDQNFLSWLDVIVPSTLIGIAITSIGTFFDGSNYGSPTHLPWGVNFENPAIKYAVAIHPTQIYSFLYSTLIATTLILLMNSEKMKEIEKPGFIALLGLISYNFCRFLEEFVRGDDTYTIFSIRLIQIVFFLVFATLSVLFYRLYLEPRRKNKKLKTQ